MCRLTCLSLKTGAEIPMPAQTLLCLGNFDGVHLAHQALLRSAAEWRAQACPQASVGVFCYRELPALFLDRNFQGTLCSLEDRLERYRVCGMEFAVLAEFSELCDISAEDYVSEILMGRCNAVAVACGFNHRFGKGGKGSAPLLKRYFGERFYLQEPVLLDGETVSSSRIRLLLQEGKPEEAASLLTVPYAITAPVLHGKALGGQMGTPTVNQRFPIHALIPKRGVYVTACDVDGKTYRGVTNVGCRPTVENGGEINCETYLLDFSGDLYGRDLTVRFLKYLREEQKFDSAELLWRQIAEDIQAARDL